TRDLFRQYHSFASTLLDRVFLLTGKYDEFDLDIHGEDLLLDYARKKQGCLLLGSHLGSFDIAQASRVKFFEDIEELPIKILMNEEVTVALSKIFKRLNPRVAKTIIPLGAPDAMLQVKEALDRGELIGILGDRSVKGQKVVPCKFMGKEVNLPAGPIVLATILKVPVILFFGLYLGGNRYEIYFEKFIEELTIDRKSRDQAIGEWTQRYAERLEYYCRKAPHNWFNFFDFWHEDG
ncbi:MAG: hypothetical protein R3351_09215, partial [Nitrospirales bacterium]|nr:hypothetical protein [Nitrospirales bacterium]